MTDLFKQADMRQVLHGDAGGIPEWNCNADEMKCCFVRDDVGHQFVIVRGTEFVIEIVGASDGNRLCAVWKGGMMGEALATFKTLDAALHDVKKRLPPHLVAKLQHQAGRISGRRAAI